MTFLTAHVISRIAKLMNKIYAVDKDYQGFIWFDEPIVDGKFVIDRINLQSPFAKDEILPSPWYMIRDRVVYKIFKSLRDNKVYIKINFNGYRIKLRPLTGELVHKKS